LIRINHQKTILNSINIAEIGARIIAPLQLGMSSVGYIPELNGLKGLAVLMVLLFHAGIYHRFTPFESSDFPNLLYPLSRGVQLFFVVSGYSLARRYENGILLSELKQFYLRRIVRTWPLWWTICFVLFVIGQIDLNRLFLNLSFTFGFLSDRDAAAALPVAWSLFIEEVFYLLFPLLIFFGRNLLGAIGLLAIAIFLQNEYVKSLGLSSQNIAITRNQWMHIFYHFHSLVMGIAVFQVQRSLKSIDLKVVVLPRLLDLLALFGVVHLVLPNNELKGSFCMSAILLAAVWQKTVTAKFFRIKVLQTFGFYCYGVYLLHSFTDIHVTLRFGEPVLRLLQNAWLEMAFIFLVGIPVTLGIAMLSYFFIENRPIQFAKKLGAKS
jgi:peptidoglycan/LPS O-acetylase OafA/YrhL